MKSIPIFIFFSAVAFYSIPMVSWALSASAVNFNVKVNVTAVVCHINDDIDTPTIEFGDVRTDLIDGSKYAQPLPVTISCEGGTPSGGVEYMIKGDVSSFNSTSLKTDTAGLGINVLNSDNTPLGINQWIGATPEQTLNLKVVPVKDNTTQFSGGEFSATATLVIQMK